MAVPDFIPSFADSGNIAHRIAALIIDDLRGTGRFTLLDSTALATASATGIESAARPRFETWRSTGVRALVTGSIDLAGEKLKFRSYIWDVQSGLQLRGEQRAAQAEDWRPIGHAVSRNIYELLIGGTRDFEPDRN